MKRRAFAALAVGLALAPSWALAQGTAFPNKPVKFIVPYAAGGAVDVLARTIGQSLGKTWGKLPVIENRPGAGGLPSSPA